MPAKQIKHLIALSLVAAIPIGCGAAMAQPTSGLPTSLVNAAAFQAGNPNPVRFNEIYRVAPHNVYKPGVYDNLTDALNRGARNLEIDVYNSAACTGQGPCPSANAINTFMKTALQNVIAGQAVPASGPANRWLSLEVKHAPTEEDRLSSVITPIAEVTHDADFYGNNCAHSAAPRAGFLAVQQLSGCLQEVRNWMDNNPGHSPIVVFFDVKEDMNPENAMAFDMVLRAVMGDKLFTPAELKGSHVSPRARVQAAGWPTMEAMRGRLIAIYTGGETKDSSPNGTMLKYIERLRGQGFMSPASFVCPRARNVDGGDNTSYNFPFGRVSSAEEPNAPATALYLGEVVCYNIFTGTRASTQETNEVSFRRAMELVDRARADNLLSNVWSYQDLLALYPEVAIEFVRRGVSWMESEDSRKSLRGDGLTSHQGFLTKRILPMEGFTGFTNYSFVLRQRNNPANMVLTKTGSAIWMQPYSNLPGQQWSIDDLGRIFSMEDRDKCIGFSAQTIDPLRERPWPLPTIERDYRVRPGSFYDFNHSSNPALPFGYKVAQDAPAIMVPCTHVIGVAKAMTLVPSGRPPADRPSYIPPDGDSNNDNAHAIAWGRRNQQGGGNGGRQPSPQFAPLSTASNDEIGITIQLNPRANESTRPLFLTPSGYTAGSTLSARGRMHNRVAVSGISGASASSSVGATSEELVNPVRNASEQLTEELVSEPEDGILASGVSASSSQPLVYLQQFEILFDRANAQLVRPELASVTPPKSYFTNLPPVSVPLLPVDPTWRIFPTSNYLRPLVLASSLPAIEKTIWNWAYWFDYSNGQDVRLVTLGLMEWWHIDTDAGVAPGFLTPEAPTSVTWQVLAHNFLSKTKYEEWVSAVATRSEDVPSASPTRPEAQHLLSYSEKDSFYYRGVRNTRAPEIGPIAYWHLRNHKDLWLLAQTVLAPAEKAKWDERLKYRESDFFLDDGMAYIAEQLLERNALVPGVSAPGDTSEYGKWLAEKQACTPATCEPRYRPHANWPEWKDVPFEPQHAILAEAAFNSPDSLYVAKRKPADWALWNKATSLKAALAPNEVTYKDIPVDDEDFLTIVNESGFIGAGETEKFLERRRLERDFVAQNRAITHLDVDPDSIKEDVARQYLSEAEFLLWQERTAVTLNDVPVGAAFAAHPAYHKLLSTREKAQMTEMMARPDFVSQPMPTLWFEALPANNRRFAAQHLLTPPEYLKWLNGRAATQADFPQAFTNWYVDTVAVKTLDSGEYQAWKQSLGANPPQQNNLTWLMVPLRASATTIAERVLPNPEIVRWKEMLGKTVLRQHLGTSRDASKFARSVLPRAEFDLWLIEAETIYRPLNWQAFRHDRSLVQERIVQGVFGTGSNDHNAWLANP